MMAFAVIFTYSVMHMNGTYAATAKKPAKVTRMKGGQPELLGLHRKLISVKKAV